jgi:de-etiolated-1
MDFNGIPPRSFENPWTDLITAEDTDCRSQYIRKHAFETFFKLKFRITVAPQGEQLNRECSLFTEDSQYMIVGSATYIQDEYAHPQFHQIYRNNESVEPNPRFPLEDYSIHLIDIRHGVLSDTIHFGVDKIYLSHNQGIYLYNQTLAILSVQHQTIHIFQVSDGQFHAVRNIGRFCHEDDDLLLSGLPAFRGARPYEDIFINTLKHRLLVFIYRKAAKSGELSDLVRFHQYYDQLKKLRIWKMQLLDEDHLLLKYSSPEVVTLKSTEPNSQYCLFVVYNISKTTILAVFENTSEQLVDLFEGFSDNFRNNFMTQDARYSSSPANNIYSK